MTRATAKRATIETYPEPIEHDFEVLEAIGAYHEAATDRLAPHRLEETVRGWIAGRDQPQGGPAMMDLIVAMALDLTLFTPALSGTTPFDRFLRSVKPATAIETEAHAALGKTSFLLLKILGRESGDVVRLMDMVTRAELMLLDAQIAPLAADLNVVLRLCPVASGRYVAVSPLFALDEALLAQAMSFVKPGGGLRNSYRCAAAVYRDAARHGVIEMPLVLPEGIEQAIEKLLDAGQLSEVDMLAASWRLLGDDPRAEKDWISQIRRLTSVEDIVDALGCYGKCTASAPAGLDAAFERIAEIQMETLVRREAAGRGSARALFDRVEADINRYVAAGRMNRGAHTLFDRLKARLNIASTNKPNSLAAAELDRVLERIQALRAKTVDQGCTEGEALAAAAKVAEMLDRYGLTLNEVNIRDELCEGVSVTTGRRRSASVDSCVQTIATFCDCKAWGEKASETIGFVFFGLKADVQAARFLYERIEQTFETETEAFRRRKLYLELASGERRMASNSFQLGLANGINMKLMGLKAARQAAMAKTSGSDLVPLKASVVEDELEKLGMRFTSKTSGRGRFVNGSAYRDGELTGRAFEPHHRID
ncbi:MAG: DUF2786 domain-containing protein [Nitrobacter sp.]